MDLVTRNGFSTENVKILGLLLKYLKIRVFKKIIDFKDLKYTIKAFRQSYDHVQCMHWAGETLDLWLGQGVQN